MNRIFTLAALTVLALASTSGIGQTISGQGTWETTLLGRDANRNAVALSDPQFDSKAVFLYDTQLNITWLRDADANGVKTWYEAMAWAQNLYAYGVTGWMLPRSDTTCFGYDCTASDMGHLYSITLGNQAAQYGWVNGEYIKIGGGLTNIGVFTNIPDFAISTDGYWTSEDWGNPVSGGSMRYWLQSGYQFTGMRSDPLHAFAIRPGDVLLAVPEMPISTMLLIGTLIVTIQSQRRRKP